MSKVLKVGTLFSGIGAFEHALKQLNIPHEIVFACDNGERELPLKYSDLFELTKDMNDEQLREYCEKYINGVGVTKAYREIETELLIKEASNKNAKPDSPVDLKYEKENKKNGMYVHRLVLTKEQIIALTPYMSDLGREFYVQRLYDNMGKPNYVKQSYFANYNILDEQWHEDIRFFNASEFKGELDIMVGGSCCQSFSNYGKKLGLEDVRGTLFYEYARVIKEAQPRMFIYENVQSLLSHDKGNTWRVMYDVWSSLGYELNFKILNAKDYNHPQQRTRIFLVGIRKDIYNGYEFPKELELITKSTDFLEKSPINDKYYLGKKGFEWITTPEKCLRRARVNQDVIGCMTATQQDNWTGDFRAEHPTQSHYESERIWVGKYDFKDGNGLCDAVVRKLTPRECMRLMGFDDTFNIVVNDSVAYRQAGNSIVVPVLKEIIKSLNQYI